jgi:exodeoxyribonuclease VII large subunit
LKTLTNTGTEKGGAYTPTKAAEFIVLRNRHFEDALIILQKTIIIKSQQLLAHALQNINTVNVIMIDKSRTFISRYKDDLYSFNQVVINKTKTILYNRRSNLISLLNQLLSKPKIITAGKITDLNNMTYSINYFSKQLLNNQKSYLGHFVSIVKLMSPANLLKKGFAIVIKDRKIIKDAEPISTGNDISVVMHDYILKTKVTSKSNTNGTESNL